MTTTTNGTDPMNGSAAIPQQTTKTAKAKATAAAESYRPKASTDKVREEVERAMGRIVSEALYQATNFVQLADHYDRDAGESVRYGHLVDATECVEIALTHMAMLKAAMNYRLISTDQTDPRFWPTDQFFED